MKILYAVQATGNGHIARATELLPYLSNYGETHLFLSGSNAQLGQGLPVLYRSKGLSLFYNSKGGLDYLRILRNFNPIRLVADAWQLPVENYDLVINDFESVTSLACGLKKVHSIQFGHQASFRHHAAPRPEKTDMAGEFVLRHYCRADAHFGLHFRPYQNSINWPVIKQRIRQAEPVNRGHITIYLPHYSARELFTYLKSLNYMRFQVFSREYTRIAQEGNVTWFPVDNEMFTQSVIDCHGVITGAGFETPAEAMYLGKRLMVLPIGGQYEQLCNAEALKEWNVPVIAGLHTGFGAEVHRWYEQDGIKGYHPRRNNQQIVEWLLEGSLPYLNRPSSGYWPKRPQPA